MDTSAAFAAALKSLRRAKNMSQEDFDNVSRTYLSILERGIKSPTLGKIEEIALELKVHPLTLFIATYQNKEPGIAAEELVKRCLAELNAMGKNISD